MNSEMGYWHSGKMLWRRMRGRLPAMDQLASNISIRLSRRSFADTDDMRLVAPLNPRT